MNAYSRDDEPPAREFRFGAPDAHPQALPGHSNSAASWTADVVGERRRFGPAPFALGPEPDPDAEPLPPASSSTELPFVDLRAFPIDHSAAQLISPELARFYSALPYGFEAGIPLVALADESETAMLSLRLAMGREARFARASRIELGAAINAAYVDPNQSQPPAEPAVPAGQTTRYRVIIRLQGSEPVDADAFDSAVAAKARAVEIAEQLASVDGTWPFIHGRFLRPDTVVSVDIVEEEIG
jgi:Type II secretion system (T2SS), protein E, N-terminal domain